MTYFYRLALTPDDNETLLVTSPDVLGLVTYGDDEADARRNARDALETLFESRMRHCEPLPSLTAGRAAGAALDMSPQDVLTIELHNELVGQGLTPADLRRRLGWQRDVVDRLFRFDQASTLDELEQAFRALGRALEVSAAEPARLVDDHSGPLATAARRKGAATSPTRSKKVTT